MKNKTIETKKKEYLAKIGKKHLLLSELYQLKGEMWEKEARIKEIRKILKEDKKGVIN